MTMVIPLQKTNKAQQEFRAPEILTNMSQSAKSVKTTDSYTYALKKIF